MDLLKQNLLWDEIFWLKKKRRRLINKINYFFGTYFNFLAVSLYLGDNISISCLKSCYLTIDSNHSEDLYALRYVHLLYEKAMKYWIWRWVLQMNYHWPRVRIMLLDQIRWQSGNWIHKKMHIHFSISWAHAYLETKPVR